MSLALIFRIAAVGIIIAVLNQILCRAGKEDVAHMVNIAGTAIILTMIISMISDLFAQVEAVFGLY